MIPKICRSARHWSEEITPDDRATLARLAAGYVPVAKVINRLHAAETERDGMRQRIRDFLDAVKSGPNVTPELVQAFENLEKVGVDGRAQ